MSGKISLRLEKSAPSKTTDEGSVRSPDGTGEPNPSASRILHTSGTKAKQKNGKEREHEAVSSQPADDPNQQDPNERSDMISERRNPGMHGGGGDPGWKPSRS